MSGQTGKGAQLLMLADKAPLMLEGDKAGFPFFI